MDQYRTSECLLPGKEKKGYIWAQKKNIYTIYIYWFWARILHQVISMQGNQSIFQHEICLRLLLDFCWEDLKSLVSQSFLFISLVFTSSPVSAACTSDYQTPPYSAQYRFWMPIQRLTVIESYLDGCKFNEVCCGHRSPVGWQRGWMKGTQAGRKGNIEGWNIRFPERIWSEA